MQGQPQDYLTATDKLESRDFFSIVRFSLDRWGFLGSLARYLMMKDELRKFLNNAKSDSDKAIRKDILKKFRRIQRKVTCVHSPYQFILMAKYILNFEIEGPIVQCGCYKGGSTSKLSLLAKHTQRILYVCDSFKGLPQPKDEKELFLKGHGDLPNYVFSIGEYKGDLEEAKENVRQYGCIEVCKFIPGLFNETLPELDVRPAFVFIDVDLISSARDCLQYLWPRLAPNGYWFTHEAIYPEYISGILDAEWWHDTLGECPPIIMGGGSGLSQIAESLAYFQKVHKKMWTNRQDKMCHMT